MKLKLLLLGPLALLCLALPRLAHAEERITQFTSTITIQPSGQITVTESIKVLVENVKINHGIYRDFPTKYTDRKGTTSTTRFDIVSVHQDGHPQQYHTERLSNGVRAYIGDPNVIITPGEHTYELTYTTDRQLGLFPDHDELYWNITGNGWEFPIDQAEAFITLPPRVSPEHVTLIGYTGVQGSTEQNFSADLQTRSDSLVAHFITTQPLPVLSGLTVVVEWPKGYVTYPTRTQRIGYFAKDNAGGIIGLLALLLLLKYYWSAWSRHGRDPKPTTVVPEYEAPEKMSPALTRYIMTKRVDQTTLTSQLIDMARRQLLSISEQDGTYTFTKGTGSPATEEDKVLYPVLFDSGDTITITKNESANQHIMKAQDALKNLFKKYSGVYFYSNATYIVLGMLFSVLIIAIAVAADWVATKMYNFEMIPILFWLTFWSIGVSFLVAHAVRVWSNALEKRKITSYIGSLLLTLFAIPFLLGELFGLYMLFRASTLMIAIVFLLALLINTIFIAILPAYTAEGSALRAKIKGFKWFMTVTEQDRLNFHNPPHKTPALFEQLLPYALALGVSHQWAEQFSTIINHATYQPTWYTSNSFHTFSATGFSDSLSTGFGSSIAAASTVPGSSSGGSGGSSGGGGGGGGGGGW